MKRLFVTVAKSVFVFGLLAYCLWQIDLPSVMDSLTDIPPWRIPLAVAAILAILSAQALRLRFLGRNILDSKQSLWAVFICNGCNYLLPARAGEVAKVIYLNRCGPSLSKCSEMVFWERFADANALLVLGFLAGSLLGLPLLGLPLLGILICAWTGLTAFRLIPFLSRFPNRLPDNKWGNALRQFLEHLRQGLGPKQLALLGLYTAGIWTLVWGFYFAALHRATDPILDPIQILAIAVAGTLGLALPGAPGGLGVYQAALVAAMTLFGVDKAQALALAIFLHAAQYLPITLGLLWVAWRSRFNLRGLLNKQVETPDKQATTPPPDRP